jgi:hypothetical protein
MLTCNDHPVLTLALAMPRVGNWVLDVQVDADEAFDGSVVLADGEGNEFHGTVFRARLNVGRVHARIVGGRGGLAAVPLGARHYQSATARLVAEEAVTDAGEGLDPTSDRLGTTLDYWTRSGSKPGRPMTAGGALSQLADEVGFRWRVLANGNVWFGKDSDEALVLPDVLELDRDGARGTVELGVEALVLRPGDVFAGERIGRIHYSQSDTQALRACYWPEAA